MKKSIFKSNEKNYLTHLVRFVKQYTKMMFYLMLVFGVGFLVGCPTVMAAEIDFVAGKYVSSDGKHTIDIASDNTVLFDDVYSLEINDKTNGDTITGKLGTKKNSVTFYQLNDSKIVTGALVNYIHNNQTVYLYDYTVFGLDSTPIEEADSGIEVWRDGNKINSYADLQSAVDAAKSEDTIQITKDLDVIGGAYINKDLTIEGNGKILNSSTWANSIFIVQEGVTLNINNLTIDGGATGFEVNYDAVTYNNYNIPIKTGSDVSDPKRLLALIISKGNLALNGVNLNNNYTTGNGNVNIVSGELTINNSTFKHNRATKGGVLYIGSNIKSEENIYSVKNVKINNSDFNLNYSNGNGGAILVYNTDNVEINKSNFIENTGHYASGGAIVIEKENFTGYHSKGEKLGLPFIQFKVNDSVFDGNWVGNDGAAIENKDAELTINNTIFKNNVGIHSTSSCGTVSIVIDRKFGGNQIFNNCIFEANEGAVSSIADHASRANIKVYNTKFIGNISKSSILLYASDCLFENVEFINENATETVVDVRSYNSTVPESTPPTVIFKNVNFENTTYAADDILIRKQSSILTNEQYTVVLEGNVNGNIELRHENKLIINGSYIGEINTDSITDNSYIVIGEEANIDGDIIINSDKHLITLEIPHHEKMQLLNSDLYIIRYIYSETKTFTIQEFFLEHLVCVDGYELVYYTDSAYTTPWDYSVSENITIYGKWEEHIHVYDDFILYKNGIYEQCECGYLGKKLYLEVPTDLVENGSEKSIIVKNEIGISENDYVIAYQVMNEDGEWIELKGVPVVHGKYKAKLTYNNIIIEEEYTITERVIEDETTDIENKDETIDKENKNEITDKVNKDEVIDKGNENETTVKGNNNEEINKNGKENLDIMNPNTSDNIISTVVVFIVSTCAVVVLLILRKKV